MRAEELYQPWRDFRPCRCTQGGSVTKRIQSAGSWRSPSPQKVGGRRGAVSRLVSVVERGYPHRPAGSASTCGPASALRRYARASFDARQYGSN
jgi:hypothetical protein